MVSRSQSLREIADSASLDYDDALVMLWDAGVDVVDDIDSKLSGETLKQAHKALRVPNAREMQRIAFWSRLWDLGDSETRAKLQEYGIHTSPNSRNLPKGSVKKLRKVLPASVVPTEPAEGKKVPDEPDFTFRTLGRKRVSKCLSVEEIASIHEALVKDFSESSDPIEPAGIRDENLLASAAFRPETSLGDERKYQTAEMAAAALLHSLVLNHAFHNGNKRTAIVSMLVYLDLHDLLLTCTEGDLFRLVLRVAKHGLVPDEWSMREDRETFIIAEWICSNSRGVERSDRILKWNELKRILADLGCTVSPVLPGNRIKITRIVEERTFLGFKKTRKLTMTANYQSSGAEVDQRSLAGIRKQLQLDYEHGYDSGYFYRTDKHTPDEFISQYRTLLKRLSKL